MSKARRPKCRHQDHLIQVAYTQTGVGRFRSIEWCARCGALVFRDYGGGAGEGMTEEWRRPALISKRAAARSSTAAPRAKRTSSRRCAHHWEHRQTDSARQCITCGKVD